MSDLKKATANSLAWNAFDKVGVQVIALFVGIMTARLLSKEDFGYIAALAMFTMLSSILVDSGFTSAMVRRKENTQRDYTGVFCFNVLVSSALYLMLFFFAPSIANYFNMPVLNPLAKVLFLAIIINAFGIVPTIILTRKLKFKYLSAANLISAVLSAFITIYMALRGYGYWAIAAQQLSLVVFKVLLLWVFSRWLPSLQANFKVIKELFAFSATLIVSSIINTCVRYVYNFIIGPRYSAAELGCYGQSYKFQNITTTIISTTLTGVSYPVLSKLNDEKGRQLLYFRKLMRICAFLAFPALLGLFAIAPNFITVVITDKWMPMLPYFRILLLSGAILPFFNMATNTLIALGYPKKNLQVTLVRNGAIIVMLLIMNSTIEMMLWGFLAANVIGYVYAIIMLGRYMKYSFLDHLKDIFPYLALAIAMVVSIELFTHFTHLNVYLTFVLQLALGAVVYLGGALALGSQVVKDVRQWAMSSGR